MKHSESIDYNDDSRIPRTPSFSLAGKRALVTGAGTGLGRAATHALAQAGADVVLLGRRTEPLEVVAEELQSYNCSSTMLSCDVQDREALKDSAARWGDLDILVNNAGYNNPEVYPDLSHDAIDRILDLNIRAAIEVAQIVTLQMRDRAATGTVPVNTRWKVLQKPPPLISGRAESA